MGLQQRLFSSSAQLGNEFIGAYTPVTKKLWGDRLKRLANAPGGASGAAVRMHGRRCAPLAVHHGSMAPYSSLQPHRHRPRTCIHITPAPDALTHLHVPMRALFDLWHSGSCMGADAPLHHSRRPFPSCTSAAQAHARGCSPYSNQHCMHPLLVGLTAGLTPLLIPHFVTWLCVQRVHHWRLPPGRRASPPSTTHSPLTAPWLSWWARRGGSG